MNEPNQSLEEFLFESSLAKSSDTERVAFLDGVCRGNPALRTRLQPEGLSAPAEGNAQPTDDGNLFVGWGALSYTSAFDASGNLTFNAQFPLGVHSYRAYLLPFKPGH